jgi:hypothetical protein
MVGEMIFNVTHHDNVYRVVSEVSMVAVVFKNIKINNIFQKQA